MSIRRFFSRDRWDAERARELDSYISIETDENIARGIAPDDARAAALPRVDPGASLKSATRGNTDSRERFGLRRGLVVAQVALSLVLLVGAVLFVRTLRNLTVLDAGFQRTGILLASVDARPLRLPTADEATIELDLLARVRAIPGVDSAAAAYIVPLSGMGWNETIVVDASCSRITRTSTR